MAQRNSMKTSLTQKLTQMVIQLPFHPLQITRLLKSKQMVTPSTTEEALLATHLLLSPSLIVS